MSKLIKNKKKFVFLIIMLIIIISLNSCKTREIRRGNTGIKIGDTNPTPIYKQQYDEKKEDSK